MNHETSRSFFPVYPQQMDCKYQAGTLKITETSAERDSIKAIQPHVVMLM
ncbi:hypothetical protein A2U01_0068425, partial [Trifolium medium]|nr:hypothetical protein [Trifolium medium]